MPTEKRARQKAARREKRAAQARRAKRRKLLRNSIIVAVLGALVIGLVILTTGGGSPSSNTSSTTTTTFAAADASADQKAANAKAVAAGCPKTPATRVNTLTWSSPPAMSITTTKTYTATVKTTAGSFVLALDAKAAPTTVNNFVFLAKQGFYNCVIFHRVIPDFMDQTGDPTGTGSGGPGYQFSNENVPTAYATGDVAMANSGGTDTDGSQFFIVVPGGASTLDSDLSSGDKYSLFAKVTSGMSVVEQINAQGGSTGKPKVTQRVLSVTIHEN